MVNIGISLAAIIGTIAAYIVGTWLYKKVYTPLLLPVAVATLLVVLFLVVTNTSYETYMEGAKWIDLLLGPAVVSLAYPLYQNREILKDLAFPIFCGTFTGAIVGITTGVFLADLLGYEEVIVYSLTPKSVTTPVAMDISETLSGISSLAAVFVMIAGIFGAMFSTFFFKMFHIDGPVGEGVGLGSASHAIGTSRALESGLKEGSISTIAMILSAVFVSVLAPFIVEWIM
ncbi:MAG TPA: LrgB family protein [Pseudogracilibacillus sp.]|nr:LrgB family protein [Pseudogracilibacillus sp.]